MHSQVHQDLRAEGTATGACGYDRPCAHTICRKKTFFRGLKPTINSTRIAQTLCGFKDGIKVIDWKASQKGPIEVLLLAAELRARRATASVESIVVDSTGDMLWTQGGPKTYTLTAGEERLNLSFKNLCPADAKLLSTWLGTPAGARLTTLDVSNNFMFGSKDESRYNKAQLIHDVDNDQSGWDALCDALRASNVTSFTALDVGMGPNGRTTIRDACDAIQAELII